MNTMRPIRSIATVLVIASVAVAGCARSQPNPTELAGGQPPAVTAPATSAPPATQSAPEAPGNDAVVLADGRHPVYLKSVDPGRRTITFDLIQMYWGDEAAREAAKDHQESPPPNDYYIRNVNPRLRTLPVRADAAITVNTLAADRTGSAITDLSVPLAELATLLRAHADASTPFYLTVRHDQVARIAEQYIP
jgi:hypothetical protein